MKNEDILAAARKHLKDAHDADEDNRDRDLEDREFVVGDQWDEDVKRLREADGKPCLTVNGLSQYLRQVTAQVRNMNPSIKVGPSDNDATDEVAEIYEGLIRHIEQKCDASSVYEAATESAATGGIGYFRVRSDYVSEDSFDQEALIERIYNPFAVFIDPMAKHPCRMDMNYCLLAEEISEEDFKEQYPGKDMMGITGEHKPESYRYWSKKNAVVVAEYYWIEHEEVTLGLLEGGQVVENPVAPLVTVKTRKARRPRVKWAKVSHGDVLEGPIDIPGRYIPVFAVTGEEIHVGEYAYRSGVIRHAKDPQTLYNYARSSMAEVVALQPKAPYIGTAKQFEGFETFWNEANTKNRPYLPYRPDDKAPGPPQRQQPPVTSSGWMAEMQVAAEDMKRTTGIYDAGLGAQSNETSGVAINARKMESQASTSVYADNMIKAITHCGTVLVEMIPAIYDTRRTIRILGADDKESAVLINSVMTARNPLTGMTQSVPINDVTVGRYDVRVSVGPAYETQRAEARDGMMQFLAAVPDAGAVTADLVASAQDWPDADQFAERLKKTLPPGIAEEEGDEGQQMQMQIQQAVQAQLQQIVPQMQQEIMQSVEARKANAEAEEAEHDAAKAEAEAVEARIKTEALASGFQTIA